MDFQTIILNNFLPQEIAGNVIRNTASLIAAERSSRTGHLYQCRIPQRVSRGQQKQHYLLFD
ncbi:putative hydrolase protein [Klebsiella oxytoca]|nr:putative hydrolase protein [Klebsiella oxytoca]